MQKEAAMTIPRHHTREKKENSSLPSPAELLEQYAALIWKICSHYLSNPEDIKECVNDTFMAFYMQSEKFDPAKGSVPSFLSTIARNKAVSRARKIRLYSEKTRNYGQSETSAHQASSTSRFADLASEDIPDQRVTEDRLIERIDLEAAMQSLDPEEFDLIRMKYYDGMTIREIAKSMNLPYETVKKRHQRSLSKLRRYLTLTLIILVIAVVLSACAYFILRYFNIVPGYGVTRTDKEAVFYVLDEEASVESGQYEVTLIRAFLYDGILGAEFLIHSTEPVEASDDGLPWYAGLSRYWAIDNGEELIKAVEVNDGYKVDETTQCTSCCISLDEEDLRDELFLVDAEGSLKLPLTLVPADSLPADRYNYEMGELGGFAIEAYIEDGHLLADIYSLSEDEFFIFPEGLYSSIENSVTAESSDGTVLDGTYVQSVFAFFSSPSSISIRTFDFGPAAPGNYTIRIDTPALRSDLPEDLMIPMTDLHDSSKDKSYDIPGGTITFGTPLSENPLIEEEPESEPEISGFVNIEIPEESTVITAPISEFPMTGEIGAPLEEYVSTPMTTFYYPIEVIPDREDLIFDQIVFNLERIDSPGEIIPFANGFNTILDLDEFFVWGLSFSWEDTPDLALEELCLRGTVADASMWNTYISYGWDYTFEIPVTAE